MKVRATRPRSRGGRPGSDRATIGAVPSLMTATSGRRGNATGPGSRRGPRSDNIRLNPETAAVDWDRPDPHRHPLDGPLAIDPIGLRPGSREFRVCLPSISGSTLIACDAASADDTAGLGQRREQQRPCAQAILPACIQRPSGLNGRQPYARHDPDPRRHVPHGLGPALSRGGAGPSRHRRCVLDRPDAGHQPPVPPLRRRHRSCHRRGNRARPEGLSRRPAAHAACGLARVQPAGLSGRSAPLQPMVGVQAQGDLAASLRPGLVDQGSRRPSGRACRLCRCGGLCPMGRQGSADRSRMGIRGPRRARPGGVRLGR